MSQRIRNTEQGNVLFLILIAIALLGALTMSLTASERYSDTMDNETMDLQIKEIYQYANSIEKAVANVLLNNGCEVSQLNFDSPQSALYNLDGYYKNTTSPTDKSCHIFENEGGGVIYRFPPEISVSEGGSEYGILTVVGVEGVATDKGDLILFSRVTEEACKKINNDHDIDMPSGNLPFWGAAMPLPYPQNYTYPSNSGSADEEKFVTVGMYGTGDSLVLKNHRTGCLTYTGDGYHTFYHVILAR